MDGWTCVNCSCELFRFFFSYPGWKIRPNYPQSTHKCFFYFSLKAPQYKYYQISLLLLYFYKLMFMFLQFFYYIYLYYSPKINVISLLFLPTLWFYLKLMLFTVFYILNSYVYSSLLWKHCYLLSNNVIYFLTLLSFQQKLVVFMASSKPHIMIVINIFHNSLWMILSNHILYLLYSICLFCFTLHLYPTHSFWGFFYTVLQFLCTVRSTQSKHR